MNVKPVKTRALLPPQDDLLAVIQEFVYNIEERSILVITSKVVSIWRGKCIPKKKGDIAEKDALIIREADKYLPREEVPCQWVMHTIKNNIFIPSAGIDESNANGFYILWPEYPEKDAQELQVWLQSQYGVHDVGVLIIDSHTIPFRRGVVSISIAHAGFCPLNDYRGKTDIFHRELQMTQTDVADGLAAAAGVAMGEGNEHLPLVLLTDLPFVRFNKECSAESKPFSSFQIPEKEDLYYPFFSSVKWKKGKRGA